MASVVRSTTVVCIQYDHSFCGPNVGYPIDSTVLERDEKEEKEFGRGQKLDPIPTTNSQLELSLSILLPFSVEVEIAELIEIGR